MARVMGYKMTHDTGFAPNPFFGFLTLATCKPSIRRTRLNGDWVAGFASRALVQNARACNVDVPYMGLVYLMQVTEDPMPLAEYFRDRRFAKKKPRPAALCPQRRCGDNIYASDGRGGFRQINNLYHGEDFLARDVGGRNVLISSNFWYFGHKAFVPEGGWSRFLGVDLPEVRNHFYCPDRFLSRILDYFHQKNFDCRFQLDPCMWPRPKSEANRGSYCGR